MTRFSIGSFILLLTVYACGNIVLEANISNDLITTLAPTSQAVVTAGDVSLNWESLEGADSYHLQIATPSFENANQITLDTLISATKFMQSLEANTYEWRVKGVNSAYETAFSTNAFTVE